MRVATVFGTRPEIIKLAPLIPLIEKEFEHILIHTGQHYSYSLSEVLVRELGLRIDYNLGVGSHPRLIQVSKIMERLENIFSKIKPEFVLTYGDTNSTFAASLAAYRMKIPQAHIEAGLRSFDLSMPEEINRIVVDRLSQVHFAPSKIAVNNLYREGIRKNVYLSGNLVVDAIAEFLSRARPPAFSNYILCTIHREENTEEIQRLKNIINFLNMVSEDWQVVFPIHPRTVKKLQYLGLKLNPRVQVIEPVGYFEFLGLLKNSIAVITDSGGVQEEAITIRKPCITLRKSTERPETVALKANTLVDPINSNLLRKELIQEAINKFPDHHFINPYGDGKARFKIISHLVELLYGKLINIQRLPEPKRAHGIY
ncbi:MAG TPA: UDP-N-acetylglucosamine 2-epimerase (non-hydrolyzing) [Sulfolobales archaeon]|nr:UDP-N-acetylglucosamine 2-epimerase (non-hydrolyzing) [Sulfolobales archaeon]